MDLSGQCRKKTPHQSDRGLDRVSFSQLASQTVGQSFLRPLMDEMDFSKAVRVTRYPLLGTWWSKLGWAALHRRFDMEEFTDIKQVMSLRLYMRYTVKFCILSKW